MYFLIYQAETQDMWIQSKLYCLGIHNEGGKQRCQICFPEAK